MQQPFKGYVHQSQADYTTSQGAIMNAHHLLSLAMNARPFDLLGWHQSPEGNWLIRSWLPGATAVSVLRARDNKRIGTMSPVDGAGLFEFQWNKRFKQCAYRLLIERGDQTFSLVEPYQFAERTFTDFSHDGDTLHHNQGAHVCLAYGLDGCEVKGVRFAVFAPNARSVSVVGSFNDWDGRRAPMASNQDGIWRLFIPELQVGDLYKYEIKDAQGNTLPLKADPYGYFHEQYPSFASVISDHDHYQWQDQQWQQQPPRAWHREAISIYECHAGSWRQHDNRVQNWDRLGDSLIPYVVDMGYTHIELLPVSEYPFDGSWGYQPVGLFAPTSRFGSIDQFKRFIDRCHQAGIGVLVDWVPAHFPSDTHGLARFDGSCLYEYEDPRKGWHPDWNSHIYDYGKTTVCDFLVSSAVAWAELFHIDGIRVDAVASMLYLDYSRDAGEWVPNVDGGNTNYESVAFFKRLNSTLYGRFPHIFTVAEESTSFPNVTKPAHEGGLGFGFKWNMGWMHDSLSYMQHDPIHRQYHHSNMTFSMVYAYSENFVLPLSHDEVVHGKGSIYRRMPGDDWQKLANLRAYYGFMYAHPGKKLNFMGNEIGQIREWQHMAELDWGLLYQPQHQGLQNWMRDLNKVYRQEPALHQLDCINTGFEWINHTDNTYSILSFARFDEQRKNCLVVVSNFTPMTHNHHAVGVPKPGRYQLILNSDASYYGGSDFETGAFFDSTDQPADHKAQSINIKLPPLATVVFKLIAQD